MITLNVLSLSIAFRYRTNFFFLLNTFVFSKMLLKFSSPDTTLTEQNLVKKDMNTKAKSHDKQM